MWKAISFLAIALLSGGGYLLFQELIVASDWAAHRVAIGCLMTIGGIAWLWTDFLAPNLRVSPHKER